MFCKKTAFINAWGCWCRAANLSPVISCHPSFGAMPKVLLSVQLKKAHVVAILTPHTTACAIRFSGHFRRASQPLHRNRITRPVLSS